jgi:hypothetical protein
MLWKRREPSLATRVVPNEDPAELAEGERMLRECVLAPP